MEILRNLILAALTASENAVESSGETEIPVGADMTVVANEAFGPWGGQDWGTMYRRAAR